MRYKTLCFLVLVFLSTSDAVSLANFTDCALTEYLCDTRKCTTQFIKNVQNHPKGDCGTQYNETLACIIMSNKICGRVKDSSDLSNQTLDDLLRAGIKEEQMCNEALLGGFIIPMDQHSLDKHCSNVFVNNTEACLKTYHDKFMADRSDATLCEEHAKAKKCWMKAIESDCKYPSDFFEAIRFDLVEYNPFCANNRHPGATGSDQCLGVRDIKNPFNRIRKNDFNATAGVKINALLALFPPLVSVFFFFFIRKV